MLGRRKANAIKVEDQVTTSDLGHICVYKPIHLNAVVTFNRDLKGLLPVGNPYSVAGEDIPEVSRDYVLRTYYPIPL